MKSGVKAAARKPELFAVVDVVAGRVIARGMDQIQADAFAKRWRVIGESAELVRERIEWPSDDQVVEQLALVH
jgi:hypothetical protein